MLSDKQKELVYDLFKKHSCKYHFEEDPPQSLLDCDDFFDALSEFIEKDNNNRQTKSRNGTKNNSSKF